MTAIEEAVRHFLGSPQPAVLCIKGRWGVGKTFLWRKVFRNAASAGNMPLEKYSYVSLFGINSLENLKTAIFENTVSRKEMGADPDLVTFGNNVEELYRHFRKVGGAFKMLAALLRRDSAAELMWKATFMLIRKQVICLDDLERAGRNLHILDVLGLVSYLKEERECKIVLLLNDEKLPDIATFSANIEKLADQVMEFRMSPDAAANIVFDPCDWTSTIVKALTVRLKIDNIRVLQRILRAAKQLEYILRDASEALREKALAPLVLAGWSLQQPDEAPELSLVREYAGNRATNLWIRRNDDEQVSRFLERIDGYPYSDLAALHELVIDGMRNGYFDAEQIQRVATEEDRTLITQSPSSAFRKLWEEKYHGSLTTNDDEFLDEMYDLAMIDAGRLGVAEVNAALQMLRDAGRPTQAKQLIEQYVQKNHFRGRDFFNLHAIPLGALGGELDSSLQNAFDKELQEFTDERTPLEIVEEMVQRHGWNEYDLMALERQSVDKFIEIFETLTGSTLRQALDLIRSLHGDELTQKVKEKAFMALTQIASKSPLRRSKLNRYLNEIRGSLRQPPPPLAPLDPPTAARPPAPSSATP